MAIGIPHRVNLPYKTYRGHNVAEWKICVCLEDDIAWCIILSYLMSNDFRNPEEFSKRFSLLTGSKENLKSVKKCIQWYNPFRNRGSCFYSFCLKKVLNDFKERTEWKNMKSISDKLNIAQSILKCPILILRDNNDNFSAHVIEKVATEFDRGITLFQSAEESVAEAKRSCKYQFSFGLQENHGLRLKKAALVYFLNEAKISRRMINSVVSVLKHNENFLITILNSKCRMIIPDLYKSPYILKRLAEAGYETDPRKTDSEGSSAFYHALQSGNAKLLYILHLYAANTCFESESSIRDPDSLVVSNLKGMEEILKSDGEKSRERGLRLKEQEEVELIKFNEFLIKVSSRILKIRKEHNYYERISDEVFKTNKRKEVIISILETYEDFFNIGCDASSGTVSILGNYIKCINYYRMTDSTTAFLFFDNIVLLKEKMQLKEVNSYSGIESSFFLFFLMLHMIESKESEFADFNEHELPICFTIPLFYRLQLREKIQNFKCNLVKINITDKDILYSVPEEEILKTLNTLPEIKDHLLINRLKFYLDTASGVTVVNIKSVLVIERALQVIGECLTQENQSDKFSFKRFLALCLPSEAKQALLQLRNKLSHLPGHAFASKFQAEENFSLFRAIQKEVRRIRKVFNFSFCIQLQRVKYFICDEIRKTLHKTKETFDRELEDNFDGQREEWLHAANKREKQCKRTNLFFYLDRIRECEILFQNMFNEIENTINKKQFWENDIYTIIEDLKDVLWPLRIILPLLINCGIIKNEKLAVQAQEEMTAEFASSELVKSQVIEFVLDSKNEISTFITKAKKSNLSRKERSQEKKEIKKRKKSRYIELTINNIEKFKQILKGFIYLSEEDKNKIRENIPESVRHRVTAKQKLLSHLEKCSLLEEKELGQEQQNLYLSKTLCKRLKDVWEIAPSEALEIIKQSQDPVAELEEVFEKNSIAKRKYDILCERLQFEEEIKLLLSKLVAGQKQKVFGDNLINVLNRIRHLRIILIDEDTEVRDLWDRAKRKDTRQFAISKIIRKYLREPEVRASVEILLFDCMMLFGNKGKIRELWTKTSKLYNGINLRNVISHGNPILEAINDMLDPEDVPSALVNKMVQLIEDENVIEDIQHVVVSADLDFSQFLSLMNSDESDEYDELRRRICKCSDWKLYSWLIPQNKI